MFFKVWDFFSSSKIGSSIILIVDLHPWQVEESHMSPFNLWYCHLPMRQPNVDDDFEVVLPNFVVANGALVNLNNLFNCFSNLEPPPLVRADSGPKPLIGQMKPAQKSQQGRKNEFKSSWSGALNPSTYKLKVTIHSNSLG